MNSIQNPLQHLRAGQRTAQIFLRLWLMTLKLMRWMSWLARSAIAMEKLRLRNHQWNWRLRRIWANPNHFAMSMSCSGGRITALLSPCWLRKRRNTFVLLHPQQHQRDCFLPLATLSLTKGITWMQRPPRCSPSANKTGGKLNVTVGK
jgi:hypothetical protein